MQALFAVIRGWLQRLRAKSWVFAALGVFVVQNHCGVPGVAHDQLAAHFLDRSQPERALQEARRAVREAPDEAAPRVIEALALAGLGRHEEAASALEQALLRHPDDARLYGTLRSVCADQQREDLALAVLQRLSLEMPGHWLLTLNLGWAHHALGDSSQALMLLESAVSDPDSSAAPEQRVLAHVELSRLYGEQGRLQDAVRTIDTALVMIPDDARLLVTAGELRLRQGVPHEAEDFFEDAIRGSDDAGRTAVQIAVAFYNAGDHLRAIRFYERAVARRPSPLTMNNLAWTYAEADLNLDRAQELSLRAVKTDADNVVYLDTYAEVLFRQGRVAQATALMRRCLDLEPVDGDQYEYLQGQLQRFQGTTLP